MSCAAQIVWWFEQVDAARRAVAEAQADRRRPRRPGVLDEDVRARRASVASLPKTPPAQHIIRGATITGERDEERARSIPAAGGGGGAGPGAAAVRGTPGRNSGGFGVGTGGAGISSAGAGQGGPLGRARQLAAGYQPAVIKVVSYARGVTRATATGQYVQREDVPLETHDGRLLTDRDAVADEIKAWSTDFSKRAESQDVGAFRLKLEDVPDTAEGRATYEKAVAAAFSDIATRLASTSTTRANSRRALSPPWRGAARNGSASERPRLPIGIMTPDHAVSILFPTPRFAPGSRRPPVLLARLWLSDLERPAMVATASPTGSTN